MRWHTLRYWLFLISSSGLLLGGTCGITGEQVQGAFADSLLSVLGVFFTAILEQALSTIVQI